MTTTTTPTPPTILDMPSRVSNVQPPGSFLQGINYLLHQPPFTFLGYGIFWSVLLVAGAPLVGIGLAIYTILRFLVYVVCIPYYVVFDGSMSGSNHKTIGSGVNPPQHHPDKELAIVITGCDTGFGRDMAWELASKGFVVFAGCFKESSLSQYEGESAEKIPKAREKIIPVQIDVTNDTSVQRCFETVSKWIDHGDSSKNQEPPRTTKTRYLYALINNAGMGGSVGYTDWFKMSDFETPMNVNYYGVIRVTKAFLPILKDQAIQAATKTNNKSGLGGITKVINIVSVAGYLRGIGGAPYYASKHAAESLSASLRYDLRKWKIQVVTVNPSVHKTPLATSTGQSTIQMWNRLSPKMKEDYGQDIYDESYRNFTDAVATFMWNPKVVTDEICHCVQTRYPPSQLVVGSDAKYLISLMMLFPTWLQEWVISKSVETHAQPAAMTIGNKSAKSKHE